MPPDSFRDWMVNGNYPPDVSFALESHTHGGGSEAFPVGSLFLAVVATNPGTLLGYGTWAAFGAGRMLVGLDATDPDFDTVRETGGAKTHVHTDNLAHDAHGVTQPANHVFTQPAAHSDHAANIAHTHNIGHVRDATTGGATTNIAKTVDTSSTLGTATPTDSSGSGSSLVHTAHASGAVDAHSGAAVAAHAAHGSHAATDHKPPYIVVYMWERTA